MQIFITGASGFIGSSLTKKLAEKGHKVVALSRKGSTHPFLDNIPISRVIGDITEMDSLEKGMRGCDLLYHCAAKISFNRHEYKSIYQTNVEGTRNVIDSASRSGIKRVVFVSACAVFGFSGKRREDRDEKSLPPLRPRNVYAYTKKLAEEIVLEYCAKGHDAVIANPCTVYGQGDLRLNSGTLIKAVYNSSMKYAPPGGTSVVSVDDLIDGLILLSRDGAPGERYIFANEKLEFIDLINRIAKVSGARFVSKRIPRLLKMPAVLTASCIELFKKDSIFISSQIVKELFGYKYYSSKKARAELGWDPKVNIEQAVLKAISFYKANGLW
ncbi:MAG: NAD-dependent epimerase/dehydratase family protein [Candidatus Omnitrophota bacterium]